MDVNIRSLRRSIQRNFGSVRHLISGRLRFIEVYSAVMVGAYQAPQFRDPGGVIRQWKHGERVEITVDPQRFAAWRRSADTQLHRRRRTTVEPVQSGDEASTTSRMQ